MPPAGGQNRHSVHKCEYMAEAKKKPKTGGKQAAKPKKMLANGLDPSVGKATQFKPGQSGNPAGKPQGTKHLSTWIQEMMNDENFHALLPDPRDGWKEFNGRPVEAIIKTAMVRALAGEKESREWLAKYGYGTKIDVTSDGAPVAALVQFIDEPKK